MPKLTSDEVNFLVWQYLQEEGLTRTAFMLKTESPNLNTETSHGIPRSELIRLLLQGSEYDEIESQTIAGNCFSEPHQSNGAIKTENDDQERSNGQVSLPSDEKMDVVISYPITTNMKLTSVPLTGGISAAYTSKWLVIVGLKEIVVYSAPNLLKSDETSLECNEVPTCIVPEPCGILVGYLTGSVRQWQLNTTPFVLQSVLTPETDTPLSPVVKVSRSPSSNKALVLHLDGQIRAWNLAERQLLHTFNSYQADQMQPLKQVADIIWMGNDVVFAVAHSQGVAVFHLDGPTPLVPSTLEVQPNLEAVALLAYNEMLQLLAGGSDNGRVWIWSPSTVSPVRELRVASLPTPVSSIHWLGIHLLIGTTDGSIQLFDAKSEIERGVALPIASRTLKYPILDIEVGQISGSVIHWLAATTTNGFERFKIQNDTFVCWGSLTIPNIERVVTNGQKLAVVTREHTYIVDGLS